MDGRRNKQKKPKNENTNNRVIENICVYNDRWGVAMSLIQVASFNSAVPYCIL